jgi:mono/diheme cytochrome c family protein
MAAGRPISVAECRSQCPDFPPQSDLDDLVQFLASIQAPKLQGARNDVLFGQGRAVFANTCASCHSMDGEQRQVLTNDEVNAIAADPTNATNICRTLTTNWESGHIWAEFSSQVYKERIAAGGRGYRTMPLTGIWATAPFMHNQSIGPYSAATDSPAQRAAAYEAAMWELLSSNRVPKVNTLPVALGPFPAGTPLTFVFSRDPATGALLCDDAVENHGHYFGANLSVADKAALNEWLKFQ